jgi:hypothetical protein
LLCVDDGHLISSPSSVCLNATCIGNMH